MTGVLVDPFSGPLADLRFEWPGYERADVRIPPGHDVLLLTLAAGKP